MSSRQDARFPAGNQLLDSLPPSEYGRLRLSLEPVRLPKGRVLFEVGDQVGHAYFITSGMVSLLAATGDGATVQIAMVGNEGLVGVPAVLRVNLMPYRSVVQLPATATRIRVAALDAEFARCGRLQDSLLRYLHALITQISQSAVCNRYHTIEQRLCRWLLISGDRVRSDTIHLTQESLSHMLGVQRSGVTAVAGALQRAGLIRYGRGRIQLIDRRGMEAAARECYRIVREQISHIVAA
ncbi:MAG: Crp/Fnr family transcriptional regulator [Pyrinomonadaceae bacterium]